MYKNLEYVVQHIKLMYTFALFYNKKIVRVPFKQRKMKKLVVFVAIIAAFSFISCGNKSAQSTEATLETEITVEEVGVAPVNTTAVETVKTPTDTTATKTTEVPVKKTAE